MGLCNTLLLGAVSVVAVSVFIAYITAPTFPPSASNHGLKTAFGLIINIIVRTSDFASYLGFSKVNTMRSMFALTSVVSPKHPDVEEITTTIEGIEVLIMKPVTSRDDELRPGIIHIHGGGWVIMTPTAYASVIRETVIQTQAVIISVNYRKAPEDLFPAAIEDCIKVTKYILKNADKYGLDKNRIGIKGDSAGGNLAMAVAIALAQDDNSILPNLKFMALDYPALQTFDFYLPCYIQYNKGPGFLTKKVMIDYWLLYAFGNRDYFDIFAENAHISKEVRESKYAERVNSRYLPERFRNITSPDKAKKKVKDVSPETLAKIEKIVLDPMFSPLMASDDVLARLPRTYIMNAEFDVLRDDGFIAAERLRLVGVEVEHSYLQAEEHGFLNIIDVDPNIRKEYENFARFFNDSVKL